jgi:hypothetical protein
MNIDFKDLHFSRCKRKDQNFKSQTIQIQNTLFSFFENPGYLHRSYWNTKLNSLLNYIFENKQNLKDKDILILFDGLGLCALVASYIGARVSIVEEKEYWTLIRKNVSSETILISPSEFKLLLNKIYDYILIAESVYCSETIQEITKYNFDEFILGIDKSYWIKQKFIAQDYDHQQLTPMRSNQNVIFRLKRKKFSWLELSIESQTKQPKPDQT